MKVFRDIPGFLVATIALAAVFSLWGLGAGWIVVSKDEARAQIATAGLPLVPNGYCQLTSIDAATLVSTCPAFPALATLALISPETQAIRYRDDGTAPTPTIGMPVAVGTTFQYQGTLSKLQVISQTAGAKINVLFYKSP